MALIGSDATPTDRARYLLTVGAIHMETACRRTPR